MWEVSRRVEERKESRNREGYEEEAKMGVED